MDDAFQRLLARIHDLCTRSRAPYAFIGGLALCAYGSQRPTEDSDIVLDCDLAKIDAFLARAEGLGFKLDPPRLREPFKHQLVRLWWPEGGRSIKVDIQITVLPHTQQALRGRRRLRVGRRAFWFARPEDLIVLKLIAARPHDLTDVGFLLALPPSEIDREYLDRTIREWKLEKLLAEAERIAREGEQPKPLSDARTARKRSPKRR